MDNFIAIVSDVWNRGFLGVDLGSIISSLAVILIAFLFRGFIISVILNSLGRLADKTESKIDDEIFITEENIRGLKKDHANIKLEFNYLSSAEKLLEFQDLYFDDELIQIDIQRIKVIYQKFDKLKIEQLKLINE